MAGEGKLYSLAQIAEIRPIAESTLRQAILDKKLPAQRIGKRTLAVTLEDVDVYLENRPKRGRPPKKSI